MALISAARAPDAADAVEADASLRAIGFHLGGLTTLEREALRSFPGGSSVDRDVRWMLRAGIQCKLMANRLAAEASESPLSARARVVEARELLQMVDGALGRVTVSVSECEEHQVPDAQETQARFVRARHELDAEHSKYRFLEAMAGEADKAPSWGDPADQAFLGWSVVLGKLRPVVRRDPDGLSVLKRAAEEVFIRFPDARAESRSAFRKAYEGVLREGRGPPAALARESWRALRTGDLGGERVRQDWGARLGRLLRADAFVRGLRVAVAAGLFLLAGTGAYVNWVVPASRYDELPTPALHELAPELERGYIVHRDEGGDVFFGQLSAARERMAPERAGEMVNEMRRVLGPLGVRQLVITDRNRAPFASAKIKPPDPAAEDQPAR